MESATWKMTSWLFTGIIFLSLSVVLAHGSAEAQSNRYRIEGTSGSIVEAKPNATPDGSRTSDVRQPGGNLVVAQSESLVSNDLDSVSRDPVVKRHVDQGSEEVILSMSAQRAPGSAGMILLGIGLIIGAGYGKRKFLKK